MNSLTDKETCKNHSKVTCKFCSEEYDLQSEYIDKNANGFWCDRCDNFTFYDQTNEDNRGFIMILEGKAGENEQFELPTQIKLNKRISPLRYPGGKSKLANYILSHMNMKKTDKLISPFIGGGSVEFALLEAGVFKELVINDYDFGIYSLFEMIKKSPEALTMEIKNRVPTIEDFKKSRAIIKANYVNCSIFEAAWSLLLVNRLAYSGIYKANPLGGIRGSQEQMLSRWNPNDLCKRIETIHSLADRFTVHNLDALQFIEEQYWQDNSTILIDPPYYEQGKNLYLHYYTEEDHISLQQLLESLYAEFPSADLLVTYDDVHFIESIYNYPNIKRIKRKFSA